MISSDATFADLQNAIQGAFGWEDTHLWIFQEPGLDGENLAGVPNEDDVQDNAPNAWKGPLANFFNLGIGKDRCVYNYDFGDRWHHDVVLEGEVQGAGDFFRRLVMGERDCPPEDCGGVFGYERMVEFLATGIDPDGEDAEALAEWVGKWRPDDFDLNEFQRVFDQ